MQPLRRPAALIVLLLTLAPAVPAGLLPSAGAAPRSSAPALHSATFRIRALMSWTGYSPRDRGARQVTSWFLDRPRLGCSPALTGSGRQVIEFWEPENAVTVLHMSGSRVTPAGIAVEGSVTRYGTATLHLEQLPYACTGDRGRAKGPVVMGIPDPNWTGSEAPSGRAATGAAPGYPGSLGGGHAAVCGRATGVVHLHMSLRGQSLHMTGEFVSPGEARTLAGQAPIVPPLIRSYRGNPHGTTMEDVDFSLQNWPPLIYGNHWPALAAAAGAQLGSASGARAPAT